MEEWEARYYGLRASINYMYERMIDDIMSRPMTAERLKACAIIREYHKGIMHGVEEMENNFDGTDFDEIEMNVEVASAMAKKMMREINKFQEDNQ